MALPCRRHKDPPQMRMSIEDDAKHVPGFALVPVRGRPEIRHRGERRPVAGKWDFDANVRVSLVGKQVIDDGKVARGLVLAMEALTLVDGGKIEERAIRARYSSAEIVEDAVRHRACNPECRDPIMCRLRRKRLGSEAFLELRPHVRRDLLASEIGEHRLDPVRGAQVRGLLPLGAFEVAQAWMTWALHILRPYGPAQGAPLLADRLLQQNETFEQRVGA